jgi:hypothetical protein
MSSLLKEIKKEELCSELLRCLLWYQNIIDSSCISALLTSIRLYGYLPLPHLTAELNSGLRHTKLLQPEKYMFRDLVSEQSSFLPLISEGNEASQQASRQKQNIGVQHSSVRSLLRNSMSI